MEDNTMNDQVTLARMEGKIDRINDRCGRFDNDMTLVHTRLNAHSERLTLIEKEDRFVDGEKKGAASVVRVLWAILGVMLTGGIGTIAMVYLALTDRIG